MSSEVSNKEEIVSEWSPTRRRCLHSGCECRVCRGGVTQTSDIAVEPNLSVEEKAAFIRRIEQLEEENQRLFDEVDVLKSERDQAVEEVNKNLDYEWELQDQLKEKIVYLEGLIVKMARGR